MKYFGICTLILACILFAGCSGTQVPPSPTPTPTPASVPVTMTLPPATAQPSFTMGDHYLKRSYALQNESDVRSEEFRVDNASWGIAFDIIPLATEQQACWFDLTVTNMDSGLSETYGYGRNKSIELHQQFPMYKMGPYKLTLKGNLVKVDLTAAKRNP